MNYNSILKHFEPVETGDFMLRYEIEGNEYILYSPEEGKVECLNLYTFQHISTYELATTLNVTPVETEEVSFEYTCEKEKMISYLFDIDNSENKKNENLEICHVADQAGYFLRDITSKKNIRNFFRFNFKTKEYQLLFPNDICFASAHIHKDKQVLSVHLCWNPFAFYLLEKSNIHDPLYLLPSANLLLCAFLIKETRDKKLIIHVDNNINETFSFLSFYLQSHDKNIQFECNETACILCFRGWKPVTIINLLSRARRKINEQIKNKYGSYEKDINVFSIYSIDNNTYVSFPNNTLYGSVLLDVIFPELNLDFELIL